MSVYSDLIQAGVSDVTANEIANVVFNKDRLATKEDLLKLQIELIKAIDTKINVMTGIFAVFIGIMTAIVGWMVTI